MPFDVGDFPGASSSDRAASRRSRRMVGAWLFAVAAMVLAMVVLGGLTRLTGSGLSIMEWAPISGVLPPWSEAEWQRLFALYQQIPQFTLLNADFQLADFKAIFWLEWVHRLWGRLLGITFLLPFLWFWAKGHLARPIVPHLLALFALGGLQGAVGWFMVASGFLPDTTAVSPYRLVVHLGLAVALYAGLVWTALGVLHGPPKGDPALRPVRAWALATCLLTVLTVLAGGFVAGLDAGLTYNSFPLMDGRLVPDGYVQLSPFILNLTENVAAVQFNHRVLATLTLACALVTVAAGLRRPVTLLPRRPLILLAGLISGQYALGIATLLLVVPVGLATLHQFGAMLLLTAVLMLLHATREPRARHDRE
jgi:cytochrome c oxidase assembly protein subunit 15